MPTPRALRHPARGRSRTRKKTSAWQGTIRLGVVFALLLGVNAYFFLFRKGTSVKDLVRLSGSHEMATLVVPVPVPPPRAPKKQAAQAALAEAQKAGAVEPEVPVVDLSDEGRVLSGILAESETLGAVLKRANVPARTVTDFLAALGRLLDAKKAMGGHAYTLRFDAEERLRALELRTAPTSLYRVERTAPSAPAPSGHESLRATRDAQPVSVHVAGVGGTVETTLFDAMKRSGETGQLASALASLFAWDVNFYAGVHPGDRYRLLVEKQYVGERFQRYGRVLAAEYEGKGGTLLRVFRGPGAGSDETYDDKGESTRRSLLKSPLKLVRVAASFDRRRFQPVLHTEHGQLGVDYGAPAGTPVWASTDGRVSWKGDREGAGLTVVITHPGGMETIYMHLSRFSRGLEVGQGVRQKQVIGYVGMTGVATVPHLHFSVKMGGHFVDPLRLKPARGAAVPPTERAAFLVAAATQIEALGRIDTRPPPREMARAPLSAH